MKVLRSESSSSPSRHEVLWKFGGFTWVSRENLEQISPAWPPSAAKAQETLKIFEMKAFFLEKLRRKVDFFKKAVEIVCFAENYRILNGEKNKKISSDAKFFQLPSPNVGGLGPPLATSLEFISKWFSISF